MLYQSFLVWLSEVNPNLCEHVHFSILAKINPKHNARPGERVLPSWLSESSETVWDRLPVVSFVFSLILSFLLFPCSLISCSHAFTSEFPVFTLVTSRQGPLSFQRPQCRYSCSQGLFLSLVKRAIFSVSGFSRQTAYTFPYFFPALSPPGVHWFQSLLPYRPSVLFTGAPHPCSAL